VLAENSLAREGRCDIRDRHGRILLMLGDAMLGASAPRKTGSCALL
jgi:hypothetical protein